MFPLALALMVLTGLPVYAVLLAVSALFAGIGLLAGAFDAALLGALPSRLVGLLEHDLLQALPLYALSGALLNRLPLTRLLHGAGEHVFGRSGAASELSALAVGALLAPMNGSVGASLHTLSRSVAPALMARGVAADRTAATVCLASTLGVVIPPSLVLLLLGDAMMRAHTEAVNATHAAVRIVNTQDVMRAVLLPGAIVLLMALALTAWRARGTRSAAAQPLARGDALTAFGVAAVIAALLAGVASGRLYAVEAAATGCVLLGLGAGLRGQLPRVRCRLVLRDTMNLTGALLALLVGATAFSLVLHGFDSDALIARGLHGLAGQPVLLVGVVLAGLLACSFVLDAFEMIFLVIPLVMPPVLRVVDDAAWMAALTLLVLQLGFLLPPFGYALVMSRALLPVHAGMRALARVLWPQLAMQALLIALVLAFPQLTQWARPLEAAVPVPGVDADRLMQEAIDAQRRERDAPAGAADSLKP
jgi:TRAP-type mannitol/chloroaromatic compound transport system permease large subunit